MLEMMIVVGIVGIVAAAATSVLSTVRQRATVERALYRLRARVDRARSLAAVAGSRLNTPRLVAGPGCPAGASNLLWGQFTGADIVVLPDRLSYDSTADIMTVSCRAFDLGAETDNRVTAFNPTTVATTFAFSPSGRLIHGGAGPLYFEVQSPGDPTPLGFTVLMSGVSCRAAAPGQCNEDPGT